MSILLTTLPLTFFNSETALRFFQKYMLQLKLNLISRKACLPQPIMIHLLSLDPVLWQCYHGSSCCFKIHNPHLSFYKTNIQSQRRYVTSEHMTSKFSELKYPALSLSPPLFYLSLPHNVSQSLTPSRSVSTVRLQSLPSKKEAVGGSVPPPHNESIQSTSEEKHLTGSALSSHKTKKGKGEMERKKGLVRPGTRNSPYCKRAVSWQQRWLSRENCVFPLRKWKSNMCVQSHVYMY